MKLAVTAALSSNFRFGHDSPAVFCFTVATFWFPKGSFPHFLWESNRSASGLGAGDRTSAGSIRNEIRPACQNKAAGAADASFQRSLRGGMGTGQYREC